jgi:predicted kinase
VVIVDAIEFNEAFRAGDPVADMAFLVMELVASDRRDLAAVFRDSYVSASKDREVHYLLPFYVAYRAAVRGKVNGMKAAEAEIAKPERDLARARAQAHWLVALRSLEDPGRRPCLVLVGGLPGTGKTTLAGELAARAGFQMIRSDQVRKELASGAGQASRPSDFENGIYSPEWTDRTYRVCLDRAEAALLEGRRVLVDATFREESRRRSFLELAQNKGVPGILLICDAVPSVVRSRLESRRHDLSDADWAVHIRAAREWEPLTPRTGRKTLLVETTGEPDRAVADALEILRGSGLLE